MKFNLKKECENCPFSKKCVKGWLGKKRIHEILENILYKGLTFTCHKTLSKKPRDQSHCFGAIVMVNNEKIENHMLTIAARLGLYKYTTNDLQSKTIFKTKKDCIKHHSEK